MRGYQRALRCTFNDFASDDLINEGQKPGAHAKGGADDAGR